MKGVPWWVWVSATPMGLGAWAPIAPGKQRGRPLWIAAGVLWSVIAVAGWVAAIINDGGGGAGGLIILGWVGAFATALVIRPTYVQETGSSFARGREEAQRRLEERREGQRIAAEEPDLAVELGIGRPDLPGASTPASSTSTTRPPRTSPSCPASTTRWRRGSSSCAPSSTASPPSTTSAA